jgi:chromosomal replication initiator protein
VLRELELQLPRATYQAWFPQTRLLSLTDGEALIAVPNSFTRDWLEQRLAGKILATLAGLALPVERLRFEVLTL